VPTRFTMLLLTACGLISIFSDNLLTRVMAWAFLDLIYFLALLFLAEADGLAPQAVLNLAFNSIGTLLAVGAAMLISRTPHQPRAAPERCGPDFAVHAADNFGGGLPAGPVPAPPGPAN
jgi:hypothetical protein